MTRVAGRSRSGIAAAALVVAVSALCGIVPIARADRTAADYFVVRGDKAAKERNWAEAQQNYRRALEEDEHHVSARAGLGDAQFASGDRAGAIETWQRVAVDAEAAKPLAAAWAAAAARAKKRLADADAATAALKTIVDKQSDDLVALAERWETKEPEVTAAALRSALRLRPEHARAKSMFERLGSPAGEWTQLFDGRTLDHWSVHLDEYFAVKDGLLVGDVKNGMLRLFHDMVLKGDFDIRVEAKLEQQYEGEPGFEICAMKSTVQETVFGIVGDIVNVHERDGFEKSAVHFTWSARLADLETPLDPAQWTTYELRFRGRQVSVLIDGKELVTCGRSETRDDGQVCLVVQNQRYSFRKVEAMQR